MTTSSNDSSDDVDLLSFLDVAARREQNAWRQREYRAAKKAKRDVENSLLKPVSSANQEFCMNMLREALGAEGLDESVCSVCDRLVLARDIVRKDGADGNFTTTLRSILGNADTAIPRRLAQQYQAPSFVEGLKGVLVSPRGFHCFVDEDKCPGVWFGICLDCMGCIQRDRLPKFAIANGFCIGRLPTHLRGLTIPERFMTQLSSLAAITRVMRGGRHRCIRSHCLAFDCTPGAPVSLLPRSLDAVASYRVVMVGDFTEDQTKKVKKMHRIRGKMVRDVFSFYKAYNILYETIAPSDDVLSAEYADEVVDAQFVEHVQDASNVLDDGVSNELESVRGQSDAWQVVPEDEQAVLERRVGLMDDIAHVPAQENPFVAEMGNYTADERSFMVRRSNIFSNDIRGEIFARLFPHLFPFGSGHPGEERRVTVSLKEAIKHYMALSGRQFAEDELFTLVAFDRLSLQNMYIQNSVRCKRFPNLFSGFESISVEQLGPALIANERRRQGCLPRSGFVNDTAGRFLKSVEIASRAVWGSNGERSQCRQKAFAYQARFGLPALFVTLTPNTDNSLAMAQYTGISSVESLFDALEGQMPSKAELREASLGNDCASARLFIRQVDAFIRCVLGIDPQTKKPLHHRGLFGTVQAYFGMVETQGRGTLHIHFLIWLQDGPSNSAEVEETLASGENELFQSSVINYTDSIVSTKIPVDLGGHQCSECGALFDQLTPLPTPERARKDPQAGLFSAHAKSQVSEPSLFKCNVCRARCSSQHLMRSALLRHRPTHWPMWKDELSPSNVRTQADREMKCRDTLQDAIRAVEERETMESSLCSQKKNTHEHDPGEVGIIDWLTHLNSRHMTLCKNDDDPFQNDNMTRLMEMLPPSTSDARIPQEAIDYMVSSLVLLLNQHWWCHTATCFKQSRATPDASFCRYGFPKACNPKTTFSANGVELARLPGHEFVNGFNKVIMATYKCNHDIQVLIGGREATHRIHYCCKYVTKQQKRLDSVVAVALGAFRRRREREQLEAISLGDSSYSALATARKRVASIVYSTTNRQEIAGPLAALYLYRGSCCYASATCATLPLGDIIRQLCDTEDYSCNLVPECTPLGESSFCAVSYLDDYIYRPDSLRDSNLYEFSMLYYRKRNQRSDEASLVFSSSHPLVRSHSLGQRFKEVVPVIQGYRLPYVDENSPTEYHTKYAILSLVLFKSFRSIRDLVDEDTLSDDAWLHAYEHWKPYRSPFVRKVMQNMDDYYSGLRYAAEQHAQAEIVLPDRSTIEVVGGGPNCDDQDDLFDDEDFLDRDSDTNEENGDNGGGIDEPLDIWSSIEDGGDVIESSSLHPAVCPSAPSPASRVAHVLGAFESFEMLQGAAQKIASEASNPREIPEPASRQRLVLWVGDASTDNALISPISGQNDDVRPTEVLEMLADTLNEENTDWSLDNLARRGDPDTVKQFASIATVSKAYTLNQKQHYALKKIGMALLTRWKKAESSSYTDENTNVAEALRADQLRMFLGGEGGTGKSRVIDAIQALCASWGRPSCLVKTALTGKAATLIAGRTLESFLLQLKGEKSVDAAIDLDLLIIDEVSMMKKLQLIQLDRRLRIVKCLPGVPFGGVHVVLVGDFLQLPPVGADPIYRNPSAKPTSTATDFEGFELWRSFEDVIVLEESVRFRNDPEWGRGCQNARRGIWSPAFVALINSRVISQEDASLMGWVSSDEKTTFVTPDNSTRLSINNLFISTTSKLLTPDSYPVRVVANFKGKLKGLSIGEVEMIMSLPDSKFGRMAPYLDLIVGMPVQVTQNVRPQKMVANGTLGTLESIVYQPGTTFRVVHDTVADVLVKLPSAPPTAVIVRLPRGDTAKPMLGAIDSDLFPLFFQSQAFKQCEIPLPGTVNGERRVLKVRIQQFPLVCAVASTIYKVQGETLQRMVVTEWKSQTALANKREQPYLLVSRVTSRYAFLALSPLTDDITRWAHPPADALEEEDRLVQLSDLTIAMMSQQ